MHGAQGAAHIAVKSRGVTPRRQLARHGAQGAAPIAVNHRGFMSLRPLHMHMLQPRYIPRKFSESHRLTGLRRMQVPQHRQRSCDFPVFSRKREALIWWKNIEILPILFQSQSPIAAQNHKPYFHKTTSITIIQFHSTHSHHTRKKT